MINRKLCEVAVPVELQNEVNKYNIPGGWDLSDKCVESFKLQLKSLLYDNQDGRCAYCGLPLETRNPEIDHIAPKGGKKRPQHYECSFLPINLVYSCHNCNSPECKGKKDTVVSKKSDDYRMWTFSIVHPYLDDPQDYFEISKDDSILVLPKMGCSTECMEKALYTIKLFKLNSEQKLTEQAKELFFIRNPKAINDIIEEISTYRPS